MELLLIEMGKVLDGEYLGGWGEISGLVFEVLILRCLLDI